MTILSKEIIQPTWLLGIQVYQVDKSRVLSEAVPGLRVISQINS